MSSSSHPLRDRLRYRKMKDHELIANEKEDQLTGAHVDEQNESANNGCTRNAVKDKHKNGNKLNQQSVWKKSYLD